MCNTIDWTLWLDSYDIEEEDEYIDFKLEELKEELNKRSGGEPVTWN